jgi:hypothetical protein
MQRAEYITGRAHRPPGAASKWQRQDAVAQPRPQGAVSHVRERNESVMASALEGL